MSLIWRRLPLILTIIVTGIVITAYRIGQSERVYQASAVIQIDASAMVDPNSDSSMPAARRVQLIEQRMMSSANILKIIDDLDLFRDAPGMSEGMRINAVRLSTRIESITNPLMSSDPRQALVGIVITSQANQPATAAAIANYFASSLVDRDRETRQFRIAEGRAYLAGQEKSLNAELSALDREIADYTSENEDSLPSAQANLQVEMARINEVENSIARELMQLQRDQLEIVNEASATATRSNPTVVQQIRNVEIELSQARRTLAADHPEIRRLEESLARLNTGEKAMSDIVRRQVALIDSQIANLNAQRGELQRRRGEIQAARLKAPMVSERLDTMTREQGRLQDQYAAVSRQLAQVETQQLLMENDQTERFVILDRAQPPDYATASDRRKRAALGVMVSTALAGAIAFALELMNPVLRSGEQFAKITGTRPVMTLPYRLSRRDNMLRWLRILYLIVLLVTGAVLSLWFLGWIPGVPAPGTLPYQAGGAG